MTGEPCSAGDLDTRGRDRLRLQSRKKPAPGRSASNHRARTSSPSSTPP